MTIEIRQTELFANWFSGLRDRQARARITARIRRLSLGNPGDVKPLGGGVSELRIDHGPGYRVYFARRGAAVTSARRVATSPARAIASARDI